MDFCAHYDQNSFDPDYPGEPLEFFESMVRRILSPSRLPAPGARPAGPER
ncbi:hypothetical protein [Streptomyces boncukensis]|nr:hypothetical protein [Streptomyces boncukensis]